MDYIIPELDITIGDKPYALRGTMQTLKNIEKGFDNEDIFAVCNRLLTCRWTDLAKVISSALENPPPLEVIEEYVIGEAGVDETRLDLFEFIRVSVAPKKKREEVRENVKKMKENLLNLQNSYNSIGTGT